MTLMVLLATVAVAQNASTADLRGTVTDPNGAVVSNATVTVRDESRNFERTVKTDAEGNYLFTLLPPGNYSMTVDSAGFAKVKATDVKLNIGQTAELPIALKVAGSATELTVSTDAQLVETNRSSVATTVDQQRIDNLPINERSYLSFALTTSTVGRDNGRAIGPAPTSGLNIGGQRGRSTLVQVDGADNTDTSVNAARSTLSQEAVQEFQVVTNSYAAEYGRASGGVVNVVSKSGSNDLHGNLFGFLRHRSFQAKNAFSPIDNPPYTRTQYGATMGGPIVKDKTFFFGAIEQRRRQESGFFTTDVTPTGLGLTSSVTISAPFLPFPQTYTNLTPAQATFITSALASGNAQRIGGAITYAFLASSGGNTALNGTNPLRFLSGPLAGTVIGPNFAMSGAPVPTGTVNALGQPIAFRPLSQLQKIFPVSEGTTFTSLRFDHRFNPSHQLTLRAGFNPSKISGIQVESQNQALGQNDVSRTGLQQFRDWSGLVGLNSTLTNHIVNEANFNYGRRSAAFRSQNGDAVAVNITGTAFFGRELFSPVARVEERYQIRDNVSWMVGKHMIKFGGDVNFVDVRANFELNFSGLFNFGGLSAITLDSGNPTMLAAPDYTPVQQYGMGFPANFIQGFGNPSSALSNKPIAFFLQDSWQVTPNVTLNFGVRYDNELTSKIEPVGVTDPLSGIVLSAADLLAAQDAMNAQQGFPRDNNNVAPRFALAWDPRGNGRSVVRAAYGLFYDHPLAAIAFNSDIADAAQQQQLVSLPNQPTRLNTVTGAPNALNASQIFQGTVCPGGFGCPVGFTTPGMATSAQYQMGRMRFNDQTFPGFGPVLPFTLHVSKDFVYAYAHQASASFEQQITDDLSFSAGYLMVGTRHLPRPIDVNAPRTDLLVQNFQRFAGRLPLNTTEAQAFSVPLASSAAFTVVVPGFIAVNNATGLRFVNPAAANFFRPNAPNYFLVRALTGLPKATFDALLAGSLRTPGVLSPYGSINMQSSNGTSNYHALNVDVKKRYSKNFQFLASYTWSHSIDDSSDLQTLLLPQDNRSLAAERSNSLFDQRHRFVFSGILTSPTGWRGGGGMKSFFADFTIAPVVEMSSGRPFNILSGVDTNADQSNQTDRPNVSAAGLLTLPAAFTTGNLGRNAGISRGFAQVDMRISRAIRITERIKLDVIGEGFNLLNRFNQAGSSPFMSDVVAFNQKNGDAFYSRPTAAFDPRQFQFGLKLGW